MDTLIRLQAYMGKRKILIPGSLFLSSLSSLLGIAPLIFIWLIVRDLFKTSGQVSSNLIFYYAWWAMGTALAGLLVYFLALMLSHLAAFRAETEMRRRAMERVVHLPPGFFDGNTSGKIRKIVDENASITHSFLAHQLPDLAGTVLMPVVALVLMLVIDWRLGIAGLVPVIFAMSLISFMMGKRGQYFLKTYMDSLEKMNTEAVEYVRGIPIVKVFQQTVFSFKNFHKAITDYRDMVYQYTLMWEKPMTAYITIIHGILYIIIPVGILLLTGSENRTGILSNIILYILITPLFAQYIMRSMYLSQSMSQATEVVERMEEMIREEPLPEPRSPKAIPDYEIRFRDVSYTYPGTSKRAIDSIHFTIEEGKTFALVGASGSGKTTIARLLPRFRDVDTGEVTIGGVNVKEIGKKNLTKHISFVFQNNRLFKMSLLDNLRYGNETASMEEFRNTPGRIHTIYY